MRSIYLIIYLLFISSFSPAKQCLQYYYNNEIFNELISQENLSESLIFKAAMKEVLGPQGFKDLSKRWLLGVVEGINYKKDFREQLQIEIQRRQYERVATSLKLPIKKDIRYILYNNKHRLSQFVSIAINGSVNMLSYQFLGSAGYLVHIPKFKVFDPKEIPDEVIHELIESPEPRAATKKFVNYKFRYGTQVVLNNIRKFFNVGILATTLIFNHQMITNPSEYMNQQFDQSLQAVNSLTIKKNLETIKSIEVKLEQFKLSKDNEKIQRAEELIESIKKENQSLMENDR